MTFYQAMQLGANALKPMIKDTTDEKLKRKYITALIVKDFLCLFFCMAVVIAFSTVFGTENSIVGVVTVILLLTFRFSNLDFEVKQSAFTLLGIFGIYMIGPFIASASSPIVASIINFIFIMIIVVLSCHNVVLCNQSTLVLCYLLLYGYEVTSIDAYINRVIGLLIGGLIVSVIFYCKQRKVKFENNLIDIIQDFTLTNERSRWQLKLSLGICTGMLIGELIGLPRSMWIGFSCMSIIQPTQNRLEFRCKTRPKYLILGCLMFGLFYVILPTSLKGNIGILGGLLVGLSATYEWQTVFNCFGALGAAIPVLGFELAIIMRIVNNVFGALYSKVFNNVFIKLEESIASISVVDEMKATNVVDGMIDEMASTNVIDEAVEN
ncbi:FUSC family protein [Paraclostridium bifermentans]|uniref:FUSC family protein n=1 Tax=Paraclostridium bifermentans TaxID=1490 RepID=UPI00359CA08B